MDIDFEALKAEFPREAISWRSQTLTRDGDKALALAYIDARDVMDRLDEVCGPANWKDEYEIHGAKTLCKISIRIDNEWVWKTDGAGDTQVEAEKGSLSDALKRAAVKWGIGRYLYALPAIWVECESYEKNSKHYFKKWKVDPWSKVKQNANDKPVSAAHQKRKLAEINEDLVDCHSDDDVKKCAAIWKTIATNENWSKAYQQEAANLFKAKREELQTDDHPFQEAAE
jgi:hypothetical protein